MTEATPATNPSMTGERRTLTVLFCDVVNSTALAEKLDPEDWAETMNEAFKRLSDPIHRYEGTVAKLMGDGMLAFFGSPVAHEDDPQRAILASLDMIEAIGDFAKSVQHDHGFEFRIRIGIHTGPVVVAEIGAPGAREQTAMGEAVHIAARMEHAAEPGTIQISGDTYAAVAPLFDVVSLGGIKLKGISDPVPAYRVTGLKPNPGRLRGIDGISAPLVGRDNELRLAKGIVDQVRDGRGQVLSLIGEAGLGKSRLLAEINQYWVEQLGPDAWHIMYGVPYDTARPFGLIQNYARTMFKIELDDPAEVIHRKVVDHVRSTGANEEAIALCTVAFERVIAAKDLHQAAKEYPAEELRHDIYEQMYPGLHATARKAPMALVVDDAHWGDPASIDLLIHLMGLTEEVPILILCAFRPERQSAAWQLKQRAESDFPHRYTELALSPLDEDDTDTLVSSLLNVTDLPAELHQLIIRKTDGNPFFVEEVVRNLVDQGILSITDDGLHWDGGKDIDAVKIPDSLQALLMARIDRLDGETKSTLQMASVIGRSFYYRILEAISDSGIAVDRHLSSLERFELLRETRRNPELEYIFKHELARDAAYATILNRRRAQFHLRVAAAIEALFADRLEEHAHRLAQHFKFGGDQENALKYFEMAAKIADRIDAKEEGIEHYDRALEMAREIGAPDESIAALTKRRETLSASSPPSH